MCKMSGQENVNIDKEFLQQCSVCPFRGLYACKLILLSFFRSIRSKLSGGIGIAELTDRLD